MGRPKTQVSVPFTSGSSLQHLSRSSTTRQSRCFSSLYIGILAATTKLVHDIIEWVAFQFPLHRDPRCNNPIEFTVPRAVLFQFPLHRDPRCNLHSMILCGTVVSFSSLYIGILAATCTRLSDPLIAEVSVPFTSGSSLQLAVMLR